MSDIKRLVSAATAQWLPVALGALAVPSGARHQRKSPQSQGPSACVCACVCETWWMSSQAQCCGNRHERDPTRKPQKLLSASSLRLLASLFIFAKGEPDEEGGLSRPLPVLSLCLSLSDRRHDPSPQPFCPTDTLNHGSYYFSHPLWLRLAAFLW